MESAKIPDSAVQDVSVSMLLLLEHEDDKFLDEFNRFIKDSDLAEAHGFHSTIVQWFFKSKKSSQSRVISISGLRKNLPLLVVRTCSTVLFSDQPLIRQKQNLSRE